MNKTNDDCDCPDFTGHSKDGFLHACGTVLCRHWEGFMNGAKAPTEPSEEIKNPK